jgi:hypothetical protein
MGRVGQPAGRVWDYVGTAALGCPSPEGRLLFNAEAVTACGETRGRTAEVSIPTRIL